MRKLIISNSVVSFFLSKNILCVIKKKTDLLYITTGRSTPGFFSSWLIEIKMDFPLQSEKDKEIKKKKNN